MLSSAVKVAVLVASTTVAVPYTVAVLCNLMYGWPQTKNKYRRALNPKKVFKLNYAVLQKCLLIRYAPLFFRWKQYYRKAHGPELIKNLVYGRNDNTMDLYQSKAFKKEGKTVVIFIYGGAWGSGDKHMYSLVCNQMANKLDCVVCCPNYSTYPRGYVDDMIQDVVDCISWVYENIHDYGGDKDRILLIGHSAGAHLGSMAILELLHDERVSAYPYTNQSITFDDTHYNGGNNDGSTGSSESFAVVSDNGEPNQALESSTASGTFEVLKSEGNDRGDAAPSSDVKDDESGTSSEIQDDDNAEVHDNDNAEVNDNVEVNDNDNAVVIDNDEGEIIEVGDEDEDESGDNDSVVTVKPKDIERHPTHIDLCKSIKGFIGLAGVYHIKDHFLHESGRGIEDISSMGQAMYGNDHFDRFSPTVILANLQHSISLPKIVLIHGSDDFVVPLTSTTKFGEVLSDVYADVTVRVVPDCDHFSLCLDLMLPTRKYYDPVMGIIMETHNKLFQET